MFWALALLALAAMVAAIWFYTRSAAETSQLRAENLRLIASEADLRARLEAERAARDQLRDQFQCLSAEALERNNRQFRDRAKPDLPRHQSGARGAPARRQQAIDE